MHLSSGPLSARQLTEKTGVSQPTVSRALNDLADQVVRIGAARSIQYALRDTTRALPEMPIHRIDAEGRVRQLGTLVPVCPDGFLISASDFHRALWRWSITSRRPVRGSDAWAEPVGESCPDSSLQDPQQIREAVGPCGEARSGR